MIDQLHRRRFWDSRRPQLDSDMKLTFSYQVHKDIYTCLGYLARSDQFGGSDFAFGGWFPGPVPGTVFAF
jgi:hypothetical protein